MTFKDLNFEIFKSSCSISCILKLPRRNAWMKSQTWFSFWNTVTKYSLAGPLHPARDTFTCNLLLLYPLGTHSWNAQLFAFAEILQWELVHSSVSCVFLLTFQGCLLNPLPSLWTMLVRECHNVVECTTLTAFLPNRNRVPHQNSLLHSTPIFLCQLCGEHHSRFSSVEKNRPVY